ncbi:hypothetical protein ACIF9R_30000 [Streptomyces sp. NPDC086080]|uniref:hypothetical protein n=1 Tax=Streptomyces sp. NPDC086080 TaxID=3365748 RepID=UPI0037D6FB88
MTTLAACPDSLPPTWKPSLGFRVERFLIGLVAHSAEEGTLPTLYAATADLPGDSHVGPDRLWGMRGAQTGRPSA